MIKNIVFVSLLAMALNAFGQKVIQLPKPNLKAKSMNMIEALNTRHSTREFAATPLSKQEISNLCWAAFGINRTDGRRTAPTAMNRQEINLYVFTTEGVYEYDAKGNTLTEKANTDQRALFVSNGGGQGFKQEFVLQAPVSLLMVIDFEKFGSSSEKAMQMGCVDAGGVSENINLYCQAVGLVTVPRATHDTEALRKLLHLSEKQLPILNNPVGYPKK